MAKKSPETYKSSKNTVLKSCTKKGYSFTGWYTDENLENKITKIAKGTLGDITLYAQWQAITYTIKYHLDGGTNNIKNPETYTVSKKVLLSSPKKEGYTFKGWYTDSAYSKKITNIKKGSSEDIGIYAKWQVNKYNIKFNANKGKGKLATLKNCEYDKEYTLPDNTFTRNGYTFKGWNTKKNGTGESLKNVQEVKNIISKNKKTVTLYAQWVKN